MDTQLIDPGDRLTTAAAVGRAVERRATRRMLNRWRAACGEGGAPPPLAALGDDAGRDALLIDPLVGRIVQRGAGLARLVASDPMVRRVVELAAVANALGDAVEIEDWLDESENQPRLFRAALLPVIDLAGTARVLAVLGWTPAPSGVAAPRLPALV